MVEWSCLILGRQSFEIFDSGSISLGKFLLNQY